jgi:hypothetical protein
MPVYLGDSSVLAEFNYEKIESDQVLKVLKILSIRLISNKIQSF